jgi:hypothetical protein
MRIAIPQDRHFCPGFQIGFWNFAGFHQCRQDVLEGNILKSFIFAEAFLE